jgi:hypothetical protein
MAFGNLSTLYLNGPGNATLVPWGTNVRNLGLASDAVANQTTTTNHGTGAAVSRTVNLFGASTTTGSQPNFGWAIRTADMGGSIGARRFYRAGVHTLFCAAASSAIATSADASLVLTVYRVGPSTGYARQVIGSGAGTPFNLGAVPGTYREVSVALTLPEIIIEPGETIQYSLDVLSPGNALVGRIITLRFGAAVNRLTFPRLSVLADTEGASDGLSGASGVMGKVLGTIGVTVGEAVVAGALGATSTTTGLAVGSVSVVGLGSAVAGTIGLALGAATTAGIGGKVLGTIGEVEISGGAVGVPEGSYVINMAQQEYIHQIAMLNGLEAGSPLIVTANTRSAGALVQTVEGTEVVTVTTTATPIYSGNVDTWIEGLASIYGISDPLVVTKASRTAGAVWQEITEEDGVVTVNRVA